MLSLSQKLAKTPKTFYGSSFFSPDARFMLKISSLIIEGLNRTVLFNFTNLPAKALCFSLGM